MVPKAGALWRRDRAKTEGRADLFSPAPPVQPRPSFTGSQPCSGWRSVPRGTEGCLRPKRTAPPAPAFTRGEGGGAGVPHVLGAATSTDVTRPRSLSFTTQKRFDSSTPSPVIKFFRPKKECEGLMTFCHLTTVLRYAILYFSQKRGTNKQKTPHA